jgi:Icc-related predicted phosphoesterase
VSEKRNRKGAPVEARDETQRLRYPRWEPEFLAELVNTYRPRIVVCAGERGVTTLGKSLVVAPGSLADGHYAVADLHPREASLEEFAAVET